MPKGGSRPGSGRKKLGPGQKHKVISISLPPEIIEWLENRPPYFKKSTFIANLIAEFMAKATKL